MTTKRFSLIAVCLITLVALAPRLRAQAVYTATRSSQLSAGAGVTLILPDYVDKNIEGLSGWVDYDLNKWLGAEFAAHISVLTPDDWAENSYEIGVRGLYHYKKFTGYGKLVFGFATLTPQEYRVTYYHETSTNSPYYGLGGGVDYRLTPKLSIRCIDMEIQQWTNFEPHTLSPILFTIGASYVVR